MLALRQFMPTFAGPSLFFLVGTAVPGMLAFRFGYRMRRYPVASFGGMLTMLIVSPVAVLGVIIAAPRHAFPLAAYTCLDCLWMYVWCGSAWSSRSSRLNEILKSDETVILASFVHSSYRKPGTSCSKTD